MPRVVIVSSYASVRAGLHTLLCSIEGMAVAGAVSGSDDLARLPRPLPDAVVFDDQEDDRDGVALWAESRGVALVVLGETASDALELAARDLPGWAYLRKEAECDEIAGAISAVASGLIVLDAGFAGQVLAPRFASAVRSGALALPPGETLTPRERDVLQLMAQGLPNKQIAARLSISLHTVKFHVASILAKLGASSRTEAVTIGARSGQVTL